MAAQAEAKSDLGRYHSRTYGNEESLKSCSLHARSCLRHALPHIMSHGMSPLPLILGSH